MNFRLPPSSLLSSKTAWAVVPEPAKESKIIESLSGLPVIFKVGLELFTAAGPSWVKQLTSAGHRIFLDLKLHDIPTTVSKTIQQILKLDVEFIGEMTDPRGNHRMGFYINGKLNRKEWGLNFNKLINAGGILSGEEINIYCKFQLIEEEE